MKNLENTERTERLVQIEDEDDIVLLAKTTMTDEELEYCITLDEEAFETFDYEERCVAWAKYIGAEFERVYADRVIV